MLFSLIGELTALSLFAFAGAYAGVIRRRKSPLFGFDLLWIYLLTIAGSLIPYAVAQVLIFRTSIQQHGQITQNAEQLNLLTGFLICLGVAIGLVRLFEARRTKTRRQ